MMIFLNPHLSNIYRKSAIEALIGLMQIHDKADFKDLVLRNQTSKIVFLVLPQISAVLIKLCQEETLRGASLVQTAVKALGRFLCLIFEDYEKKAPSQISNEDFLRLVKTSGSDQANDDVLKPKNQSQAEYFEKLKKSDEWIKAAAIRIAPAIEVLKILRGSEYQQIRNELAVLSWTLLSKCLINVKPFMPFLIENLLLFCDDPESSISEFSQSSLKQLAKVIPELNQEIAELFSTHLTSMPRIIMTGDESEQIAGLTLLNSFVIIISGDEPGLNSLLDNSVILEKFMNVMLCCCELEVPNELMFYESLSSGELNDQFYHLKAPWKNYKKLKNPAIVSKFNEVCQQIGKSKSAQVCVNHIMDNINSSEFLLLLIEILNSGRNTTLSQDQVEVIVEEFLSETYWTMKIQPSERVHKTKQVNEEWFEERTPGLYESAVEVRLRDISLDETDDRIEELNLKAIKYNILCTCLVIELIGSAATIIGKKFQKFLLRSLHRVLEKAGSTNFIIRAAGLQTLEKIALAMEHTEIGQLIDSNSDFLLFNIQKLLRRHHNNESLIDMLSVVFKFSKNSMTSYIKDIVETVSEQIMNNRLAKNTSGYLKLFQLYVGSIKHWKDKTDDEGKVEEIKPDWTDFLEQCTFELVKPPENPDEIGPINEQDGNPDDVRDQMEDNTQEESQTDEKILPEHIELVIKILRSTLQFFASKVTAEVIATHEIFIDGLNVLHHYEDSFLPIVHQMWYPFSKQFQVKNFVVLQYSFRLLVLIARYAKDFVYKKTNKDVIPVLNLFLTHTMTSKSSNLSLSYTQVFKLQREILSSYGSLIIDLDIEDRDLDGIVDILFKYERSSNELLSKASRESIKTLASHNPGLICFKKKFQ